MDQVLEAVQLRQPVARVPPDQELQRHNHAERFRKANELANDAPNEPQKQKAGQSG